MIEIIPAILTSDLTEAKEKLLALEGVVDRVQIDIIDGIFADNKTIFPESLMDFDTSLKIDYHLMTDSPVNFIERCIQGQADRIIGQIEMMEDQREFVEKITEVGLKVGLAIDLETPIERLDESILTDVDVILIMSVKAGFGGQQFEFSSVDKMKQLVAMKQRDETPFRVCVDGGETLGTIDDVAIAGVDEVSIGKRIFEGNILENIQMFRQAADK